MKMNHARIAKLLKRAYHSWGARAIAIVLIVVLSLQTVMSSGVPQVLAQEIGQVLAMSRADDGSQMNDDDGQDGSSAETLETDNGSGGSAQNGQSGEQDTEGDVDTEAVASASDDAADSEDPAATGDSASGDDSTSTATDDESDSTDTAQSSDPSEDGDQTPSDATDEAAETEDAADTDATDPDTEDVTPAERTELFNWTGDLGALKLSSTGLVIALPKTDEPENTASEAEDATGEQPDATDDAEKSATIDDAEGASASASEDEQSAAEELKTETFVPETYPAKLNLTFFLDPANADQVDTAPESIVPGDSFEVTLPSGIALANPADVIDVFQVAADGTPSTVKIAEATYKDGVLTVTFIAPVDTATGEARELSTYSASIGLDVLLSTSLAGETATQIDWLLQQSATGSVQTATLQIPARSAFEVVVELPELSDNETIAEQEIASTDTVMNVMNALTLPGMMNAANVEGSTTYSYENLTGSAQMAITWCDNNSSNRPAMADYAKKVIPQFSLDGGASWISLVDENGNLTDEARLKLYIGDGEAPNWVKQASAAAQSIGTWNVSVQGMPTQFNTTVTVPDVDEEGNQKYDEHGNPLFVKDEEASSSVDILWRLNDTNERPQNYTYGENDEGATGGQRYLMLTQDYTFTIQGKLGDKTLKEIFGDNLGTDAYAEYFRFSALIDNKQVVDGTGNVRSDTLEEMIEAQLGEGQAFDITFSEDGNTATIKATLPQYDLNGAPIVYYAYFEDPTDTTSGKDYYQPAYNNSASPSHGSSVDKLYDGGTMTIRPMGTTSYDATKVWLDGDNKENRPEVTFTLWRYSTNGKPATASQVQLDQNDTTQNPSSSVNAVSYVQITIPAGSEDTIDLGKLLAEQYGEQGADILSSLPKYDPDGYPYIYALREDTNLAGYETVYGTVNADDSVTDTQPNYQDENGTTQKLDQPDRKDDPFIYNGGTVTNRLTGTVEVEATKTWEIAAFQDSLNEVVVEFTAQSRLAGSDDAWVDTDVTIEVKDWKAETLSQTFSGTFDQYDSQGRELEYRWIETGISIDGEPVEFERDGAGGGSFTLTLENMEGEPEDLAFTSTFEEATDPDGTDTITNTFDNTTYERVDKFWEQPDGTMAQIKPQGADAYGKDPEDLNTDGIATVQLFQDGVLIGTFEMDGTVDASATDIKNLPDATYQETSSYHLDFEDLPKYNPENGVRYTYLVLETQKDGWYVDRIYDAETHTTTINNAVGEGEGSEIRVIKQWNDGDDSSHRLPVVVDLVAVKPMTAEQNIDPATGELYHYEPGDIVVEDIVLTAGESWYAEVDVPIGNVDYTYFKVVERGMGVVEQEDGSIEPQYPAVTYEEAKDGAYDGITDDLAWINTAWEYMSTKDAVRIATPDHVYRTTASEDAEPTYLEDMQAVTASNRRLGIFDLTIEKTWNDQGEHDRPQAELVVSCLENDEAFGVDDRGGITVSAGGANANTLPVVDNEGNQLFTGGDSIYRVEDGKLIIKVDTADDEYSSTYYIHGLPKYDGNGLVVHYDVEERWTGQNDEYVTTKTVSDYEVGTRHFHDNQTIEFTNTRQGTRTVTFNKEWQDRYVNESLRQRPDIYLTLYRVTVGEDGEGNLTYSDPEQVDGYVQYLWTGTPDTEDPQYEQSCSIANLPAYDENGSEYIYYASESMAADGSALDYADVKFSYEGMTTLHEEADEPHAVKVPNAEQGSDDPTENGTGWAIHEDGTFVNSLTDNLVARGTKLWEDVPANVSQGSTGDLLAESDLPEITVYLQQRVEGEDWSSLKFKVADNGTWSFVEGSEAIAWTSDLEQVTTNQYSYSMAHTGENTTKSVDDATADNPILPENEELLPRYTEDGKIYEYRAIEVVWGLVDQPGGVTSEWIETTDFSQLRESDDDSMGVYVIEHGETGSFLINNVYTSETGSLTVQKHYTGREAGDLYPETTFDVYRYYVNADGEKSDAALVDSVTLTNDMLKNSEQLNGLTVTGAGDAETTAQYTFSGLDIYAPDGSYWQYYVVEHNINGYKTTVEVGNVVAEDVTGEGETADGGVSSGGLCPESGTVEAPEPGGDSGDGTSTSKVTGTVLATDKVAEDGSITPGDTTPDVTFKNAYEPESINLSGTKTWDDYNGMFNLRPTVQEF